MRVTTSLKDVDRGYKKAKKDWAKLGRGTTVRAGLVGEAAARPHGDSGLTVAELGAVHEFGAEDVGIPERSFIRSTFDQNRAEYRRRLDAFAKAAMRGKVNLKAALNLLGAKMASDIRKTIVSGVPPPNAPSTLALKLAKSRKGAIGSPVPLIDSGRMMGALSWVVVGP